MIDPTLIARLTEIEKWHETGLLKGEALKNFVKERLGHIPMSMGELLSMAERMTHREAAQAILSGALVPAEKESENAPE